MSARSQHTLLAGAAIALLFGLLQCGPANGESTSTTLHSSGKTAPSQSAAKTAQQPFVRQGEITLGWLGFTLRDVVPMPTNAFHLPRIHGAVIRSLERDSPAQQAGLQIGDIVLRFRGRPIRTAEELRSAVAGCPPGTRVHLVVFRREREQELRATVGRQEDVFLVVAGAKPLSNEIGIKVGSLSPQLAGQLAYAGKQPHVVVQSVASGSLAAEAGIRPRALILKVEGKPVSNVGQYYAALAGHGLRSRSVQLVVRSSAATERNVYIERAEG